MLSIMPVSKLNNKLSLSFNLFRMFLFCLTLTAKVQAISSFRRSPDITDIEVGDTVILRPESGDYCLDAYVPYEDDNGLISFVPNFTKATVVRKDVLSERESDSDGKNFSIHIRTPSEVPVKTRSRTILSPLDGYVDPNDLLVVKKDLATIDAEGNLNMHIKIDDQVIFRQAENYPAVRVYGNRYLGNNHIDSLKNGTPGKVLEFHQHNPHLFKKEINVLVEYTIYTDDDIREDFPIATEGWCKIENLTAEGRLPRPLTEAEWDEKRAQYVRGKLEISLTDSEKEKFKDNVILLDEEYILDPVRLDDDSSNLILDRSTFETYGFNIDGVWRHPCTRQPYGTGQKILLSGNEDEDENRRRAMSATDPEYLALKNYRNLINQFTNEFKRENGERPRA